MRIVLVVRDFPQLSETFIASKAVGLLDRGHDVWVVCERSTERHWATYGASHPVQRLRDRVRLVPPTRFARDAPARMARSLAGLALHRATTGRYLRAEPRPRARDLYLDAAVVALEPDVVHFEFGALAVGRSAIGERLGCAMTLSFRGHDLYFVGLDDPDFYREVWHHVDRVHVLGTDLWREAGRRGAPADLPHAIIRPALAQVPSEVPARSTEVLGTADRPLRVVSVARLSWSKGYEYALEAIAELRHRGLHVEHRIIGAGELLDAMGFWRHQLGLDDHVHLLGPVAPTSVTDHYLWADVMLHTPVTEGFCNAVQEAQAHALPVVVSDTGGLPENITPGVTGLLVPRRDATGFADALVHYATDPAARSAAGAAGRARALTAFRLDDHLDAWEAFYDAALETAAARTGRPGSAS